MNKELLGEYAQDIRDFIAASATVHGPSAPAYMYAAIAAGTLMRLGMAMGSGEARPEAISAVFPRIMGTIFSSMESIDKNPPIEDKEEFIAYVAKATEKLLEHSVAATRGQG